MGGGETQPSMVALACEPSTKGHKFEASLGYTERPYLQRRLVGEGKIKRTAKTTCVLEDGSDSGLLRVYSSSSEHNSSQMCCHEHPRISRGTIQWEQALDPPQ